MLLAFMVLPIISLVATLSWSEFRAGLAHPTVLPALKLSVLTTSISLSVVVVFGTPLAWLLSQRRGRAVRVIET